MAVKKENAEKFLQALFVAVHAVGVRRVARQTGLARETLYRTIKPTSGNPRLSTLLALLRAVGWTLKVQRKP